MSSYLQKYNLRASAPCRLTTGSCAIESEAFKCLACDPTEAITGLNLQRILELRRHQKYQTFIMAGSIMRHHRHPRLSKRESAPGGRLNRVCVFKCSVGHFMPKHKDTPQSKAPPVVFYEIANAVHASADHIVSACYYSTQV